MIRMRQPIWQLFRASSDYRRQTSLRSSQMVPSHYKIPPAAGSSKSHSILSGHTPWHLLPRSSWWRQHRIASTICSLPKPKPQPWLRQPGAVRFRIAGVVENSHLKPALIRNLSNPGWFFLLLRETFLEPSGRAFPQMSSPQGVRLLVAILRLLHLPRSVRGQKLEVGLVCLNRFRRIRPQYRRSSEVHAGYPMCHSMQILTRVCGFSTARQSKVRRLDVAESKDGGSWAERVYRRQRWRES